VSGGKDKKSKEKKRYRLTRRLSRVLIRIDKGKYTKAKQTLETRVLTRLDGCTLTGDNDKRAWISDCVVQEEMYVRGLEILEQLNLPISQ